MDFGPSKRSNSQRDFSQPGNPKVVTIKVLVNYLLTIKNN